MRCETQTAKKWRRLRNADGEEVTFCNKCGLGEKRAAKRRSEKKKKKKRRSVELLVMQKGLSSSPRRDVRDNRVIDAVHFI